MLPRSLRNFTAVALDVVGSEKKGCQHPLFLAHIEYCDNLIFHRRAALDASGERLLDANRTIGQSKQDRCDFINIDLVHIGAAGGVRGGPCRSYANSKARTLARPLPGHFATQRAASARRRRAPCEP